MQRGLSKSFNGVMKCVEYVAHNRLCAHRKNIVKPRRGLGEGPIYEPWGTEEVSRGPSRSSAGPLLMRKKRLRDKGIL